MDIVERLRHKKRYLNREAADEIERLREDNERLREALIMVRDADNDCHADGLLTIPSPARNKIDKALEKE